MYNNAPSGQGNAIREVPKNKMKLSDIAFYCAHDGRGKLRVSETTYQRVYRNCANRLIEFFEDIPVTAISIDDLKDWQDWLDTRDTAVATRNNLARTARSMWGHLKRRGVDVCEPAGVFKIKKETKGVKSVSSANAWKMLGASGLRDTAFFWLLMDSARRRAGIAHMKLGDFAILWDGDIEEYYVVGEVVEKGGKPQILMAYHEAAMVLQSWLLVRENLLKIFKVEDHGYVFVDTRSGKPMSLSTASGLAGKLSQRAGIPHEEPSSLHSFRHRRAKELLRDLSLTEVRDILGHSTIKTTADQYAVNGREELMEAFFTRTDRRRKR